MKQLHQSSPETSVISAMKTLSLDTHGGIEKQGRQMTTPILLLSQRQVFLFTISTPLVATWKYLVVFQT